MRAFSTIILTSVIILGFAATGADAGILRTWDGGPGGTGTDWYTGTNWDPDGGPASDDDVTVGSGTPIAATNVNVMTGGSVTINNGAVQWNGRFNTVGHTNQGTLTLNNGSMTIGWTGSPGDSHGIQVGNSAGGNGLVVVNNGTLTYRSMSGTLSLRVGQSGGTGLIEQNLGTVNVGDHLLLGGDSGSGNGTYRIRGGTLNAQQNIQVGQAGTGTFRYVGATAAVNVGANFVTGGADDAVIYHLDGPGRRILAVDRFANFYNSTVEINTATGANVAPGTVYTLIEADLNKGDAWNASFQGGSANYVYHPDLWNVTVNSGVAGTVTAEYVADPGKYRHYYSLIRSEPGLVAYYRLNETSGQTAHDVAFSPVDGTYVNDPTLGVAGAVLASSDTAIGLDGSSQVVQVPNASKLSFGAGDFTLEAWFNTTSDDQGRFINKADMGLYQLGNDATGTVNFQARNTGSASSIARSADAYNDGLWHHIVGVREGNLLRLYVDGLEVDTASFSGSTENATDLYLGSWKGTSAFYDGLLDEVAIYNLALSPDQVWAHYYAGIVPEPSTWVMCLLGLAGVLAWRRRRT